MERPTTYLSYLIRLRPAVRGGVTGCRVSAQCVATGERKEFLDLEGLLAFLRTQAREGPGSQGSGAETSLQR